MPEYIPIDLWAETKHPRLLANFKAHLDIYQMEQPKLSEDEKYTFVRQLMMYVRQEFEK